MTLLFQDLEHHCAPALQSDGKTNNGKRPVVYYIAQSPKAGGHFLGCDDLHHHHEGGPWDLHPSSVPPAAVAIQPNGHDCGSHVVLN
jgi:hypothetical protein